MKNNRMQVKDIPTRPILEFLANDEQWGCIFDGFDNSVSLAMPDWVGRKLKIAKMKSLIRQDLVSGCCCGCRGDFELTDKGYEFLANSEK